MAMKTPTVLVAEGNDGLRQTIKEGLARQGHEVLEASDRAGLLAGIRERSPDLVIVGSSPELRWSGPDVAQEIRREDRWVPLISIVTESTEELAINALRAGFVDYFKQPISLDELVLSVNRSLADSLGRIASINYETSPPGSLEGPRMIGDSQTVRAIMAHIAKVALTDSTVLITGETGTGKELAAELIHRNSPRRHKPLVRINCAAIPDSLLESELFGHERGAFTGAHASHDGKLKAAHGGTAFFDEIGDMSPYAQAKILRVIETKEACRVGGDKSVPLDIRVSAATNQDVEALMAAGKFRSDLYFRLNVVRIHLPPLRDRRQDIPALIAHYIQDLNRRPGMRIAGVTPDALEALVQYDWPGNVRELRNLLEATAVEVSSGHIRPGDLPRHVRRCLWRTQVPAEGDGASSERDRLLSALFLANWNKCKAAQNLHWSRMTLYRKMAKYQVVRGGKTGAQSKA
jgi:DNA-binding NtrC family response regulator